MPSSQNDAAPLPAKTLRRPVDNVSAQSSALVSAMDAVRSGLWFVRSGQPPRRSEISATDVASRVGSVGRPVIG